MHLPEAGQQQAGRYDGRKLTNDNNQGGTVIRSLLFKEYTRAKRKGILFRVDRHVSGFVYLALRLKIRFASLQVMRAAVEALKKLKEVGDSSYSTLVRGMKTAWAFSEAAVRWGHQGARAWRNDNNFIHYLSMNFEST